MSQKTEGTVVLGGLIEGRLPGEQVGDEPLRDWVQLARKTGLRFSLDIDGNAFSLLPDEQPIPASQLAPDPAQTLAEALEQLLKLYPPNAPSLPFSTLRSVEYSKGKETQTLYVVQGDRTVEFQQRTVDAQTTAPEAPLTTKEKLKLAGVGLMAALAIIGILSLFVDYRAMWQDVHDAVVPINPDEVTVDAHVFEPYFTVQSLARKKGGGALIITLARSEAYPLTDAALDARAEAIGPSMTERLALQAVAQGYVRCELHDEEGKFLATYALRIAPLRTQATLELRVPTSASIRPARIDIRF